MDAATTTRAGFTAEVRAGEILHLWQKPADPARPSRIEIGATTLDGPPTDDFQLSVHRVAATGPLAVRWDEADARVSLCYAFDPDTVLADGIRLLFALAGPDPRRFRLHLAPPFGWMNDPNGLVSLDGRIHAFYQHYPHARHWDTMHWGHAVSDDLIDWTHLPVFLHPRPDMLADPAKAGGAFSGSAIPDPAGGIRLFYTDREDGRPEQEWQMTARSPDLLAAGAATVAVDTRPPLPGFGSDLRDPYVFRGPDGLWKMVLGGNDADAALVLLYETDDPEAATGWRFASVLHREPLPRSVPAECPCLVALDGEGDGLHTLVFGLVGHRRPVHDRLNPSYALVGRFDGRSFEPVARRELDFVGDCYAFQGFRHEGRPVGLAWAANWADVRKGVDFPSAMTFPRRLLWQDGALLTPPVEAVAALRAAPLDAGALRGGLAVPDGLAEIALDVSGPFRLALDHPECPMSLVHDGTTLELVAPWATHRSRPRRFAAETGPLSTLAVYVDVGLVEVYADGGRFAGTKRLPSEAPVSAVRLESGAITDARVWRLRPQTGAPSEQPNRGER